MGGRGSTLVTPMNDSLVDFDLIGQVDPENCKVRKLSFYSELIWEARKSRAKTDGVTIDWVLLRNRLQHIEARNMRRVGSRKLFFPRCRLLDSPASADIRARPAETRIGKDRSGRGVIAGVRILCRVRASEAILRKDRKSIRLNSS